jgi:hypothetical protein
MDGVPPPSAAGEAGEQGLEPGPSQGASLEAAPTPAPGPTPVSEPTPAPGPTPPPELTPPPGPAEAEEPEKPASAPASQFAMPAPGARPVAAVLDNAGTRPLPQGSLDKAQVIYELLVEGGITSFIAVHWPAPTLNAPIIGPVQRVGSYFLDYAAENDALLLHISQSEYAQRDFSVVPVERVPRGIYHDITDDPRNYQDSYTTGERLSQYISDNGIRTKTEADPVFKYSETPVGLSSGEPAAYVRVNYSSKYWAEYYFEAGTGLYLRSRNGAPHMARKSLTDNSTDIRLTAKNVLVLFVDNHTMNKEGYQSMDNVGYGTGYYFTNGRAAAITWTKASRTAPTRCAYAGTGAPVLLNPGQTYVQITPTEKNGKNGVTFK